MGKYVEFEIQYMQMCISSEDIVLTIVSNDCILCLPCGGSIETDEGELKVLHVMYISLFYFYTVKGCGIKSMRYLQ
jgi:hypothetical protein